MPKAFLHPARDAISLDRVLHALADPVRRQIVKRLMEGEGLNCQKTCDAVPASTLSFHCRVLREAGIMRSEKRGVEVINTLRKDDLEARFPSLLGTIMSL